MEELKTKTTFKLPNKRIKVVPVMSAKGIIKDPKHDAFFLFGNSTRRYCVAKEGSRLINPLTSDEVAFFEDKTISGMAFEAGDLSPYAKHNKFAAKNGRPRSYWDTREAKIDLNKSGKVLDLSNPKDYLEYKILLTNRDEIAPNAKEMYRKKTYWYALVEEDYEIQETNTKGQKLKQAYKLLGKMEDSREDMYQFLILYGKKPTQTSKPNYLEAEITKIINEDVDGFLKIAADKNLKEKILINKAVIAGAIKKQSNRYYLAGGEPMSLPGEINNIEGAIDFIQSPLNNDILAYLKAKTEE